MMEYLIEGARIIIIGMGVVFIFLIILTILMKMLKYVDRLKRLTRKRTIESPVKDELSTKSITEEKETEQKRAIEKEKMVAVISAAIATHLGKKHRRLTIKPLVPPTYTEGISVGYSAWGMAGRHELMKARETPGHEEYTVIV